MVMAVKQFQKLFRTAAGLNVDKNDIKRLSNFINEKLADLLLFGQVSARVNNRDVIDFTDLPITKGLQTNIHEFKNMDETLDMQPILEQQAKLPSLKLDYSATLQSKIPELVGGITVSLAKAFRALDKSIKNPSPIEWEKVEAIYNILL